MRALAVALIAALAVACGASVQEIQVGAYTAAEQACVAQATDYDSGVACVHTVQRTFCGPGGVFADAGICPDGGVK